MTDEAMSPLRRRMIEDMTIRKLAPIIIVRMYPSVRRDLPLHRQLDHVHGLELAIELFRQSRQPNRQPKGADLRLVLCHHPAVGTTPLPGHCLRTLFESNHASCKAPRVNDPRRVRSSPD